MSELKFVLIFVTMCASLSETAPFLNNPEPRCPCVVLLDVSTSMSGLPIEALNAGLEGLKSALVGDSIASKRVEICVMAFDSSVRVVHDFSLIDEFEPPTLRPGGATFTGTAVCAALEHIERRKRLYKEVGNRYFQPWLFLVTDGVPSGEGIGIYSKAASMVHELEQAKKLCFFGVGVQNADMAKLAELSQRPPLHLKGLAFAELFQWLSSSLQSIGNSKDTNMQVPLASPLNWGEVDS